MHVLSIYFIPTQPTSTIKTKLLLNFFIKGEVITGRESQSLTLQAGLGLLHLILIVIQTDIKSSIYHLKSILPPPSRTFPVTIVLLFG